MTNKVIHVLGNGDKASYYQEQPRHGMKLLCNMPPFEVPAKEVYATCMVDFKMMAALTEGSFILINICGYWAHVLESGCMIDPHSI